MAASSRSLLFSRFADLSLKPPQPPPPSFHHLLARPLLPSLQSRKQQPPSVVSCCLISGVDGGGVSDEFVSTRKSGFSREFSVVASMLKRIEPLDASVISKGVSDSAKDSMKQTISSMLGLLPSDQFSITVRVSKRPLHRLIVSSIITGYTLWNAEYRISLMRNFDLSPDSSDFPQKDGISESKFQERDCQGAILGIDGAVEDLDRMPLRYLGSLSPEAQSYIQHLESELSIAKKELRDQKLQENMQAECRESNNDLLEYLRSLESDMVTELSKPSSWEVTEVIHQLAQNILQRFFKDEADSDFMENSDVAGIESYENSNEELHGTVGTSRDYLAKLLFWCMLLGHHLRSLENRLHLSCVVGLL